MVIVIALVLLLAAALPFLLIIALGIYAIKKAIEVEPWMDDNIDPSYTPTAEDFEYK